MKLRDQTCACECDSQAAKELTNCKLGVFRNNPEFLWSVTGRMVSDITEFDLRDKDIKCRPCSQYLTYYKGLRLKAPLIMVESTEGHEQSHLALKEHYI